jgi:hypothetical protein
MVWSDPVEVQAGWSRLPGLIGVLPLANCCRCAAVSVAVPQGKFKPLKFTCKHRQLLLTDLFQCMAAASAVGRCMVAAKVLG